MRRTLIALLALAAAASPVHAQSAPRPRRVYLDTAGVIRWRDDGAEVRLFGANYTLPSASDFRAAGYLGLDRKKLIDVDMAQFARMGWDGLRLSFWGDWENADSAGNLLANEHLDLLDYLVAKARERGIYILLSPITTYESTWPDASGDTTPRGFSRHYRKSELGTNPRAIAAQTNYIRQLLHHVNPYTKVAYEDEPSILFIEMINEPMHHSADVPGSVAYIDSLVAAVRSTRSKAITFHNVSQDFAIAGSIRRSRAQGVTFGWYPTGLNSGHELRGSFLRTVDAYDPMRDPRIAKLPRIVYEFDSPDLRTGYMYPAMVRTMRSVGAQFAAMFAYDMLGTASRNLGWQTHYLSLVYTPRKAMSAVIAAEAMRRLPRGVSYGAYPANRRFGDFTVSAEESSSVLAADDAYMNAGRTTVPAPHPERLTRVYGYQSSPLVEYDGEGAYFLDRVGAGVWRLEVYPDAVPVRDPFELQNPEKVVTRAIWREHSISVALPELGDSFLATRLSPEAGREARAAGRRFAVVPGVYLLRRASFTGTLTAGIGALGMAEFHPPPRDTVPLTVVPEARAEFLAGGRVAIAARVVDTLAPDSVILAVRRVDQGWFRRVAMRPSGAYDYEASSSADSLGVGPFEYAITVVRSGNATTFPGATRQRPGDWNYSPPPLWRGTVVTPATPLTLFRAGDDVRSLAFSRIGDGYREGIYEVGVSPANGEPILRFGLPRLGGKSPPDYTASLYVGDRIAARGASLVGAAALRVRLRGAAAGDTLRLTLVERDGTGWGLGVATDTSWSEQVVPLAALRPTRSVALPEGYPGDWNYWIGLPADRGGAGDTIRLADVERLQFSLRPAGEMRAPRVEIEWVRIEPGSRAGGSTAGQ